MEKKLLISQLVFITFISIMPAKATDIYVAVNGDDNASGSINSPLLTPDGARLKVKALKAANPTSPITVFFRAGDYPIKSTIAFTAAETGSPTATIQFQAYPGEKVRFLGGERLAFKDFVPIKNNSLKDRIVSGEWTEILDSIFKNNGLKDKIVSGEWTEVFQSIFKNNSLKDRIVSVEARDKVLQVNLKAKSISDYGQIVKGVRN
jgi:hypothetical protein